MNLRVACNPRGSCSRNIHCNAGALCTYLLVRYAKHPVKQKAGLVLVPKGWARIFLFGLVVKRFNLPYWGDEASTLDLVARMVDRDVRGIAAGCTRYRVGRQCKNAHHTSGGYSLMSDVLFTHSNDLLFPVFRVGPACPPRCAIRTNLKNAQAWSQL